MAPDYLRQSISVLPPSKYDLRLLIVLWCSAKTRKINLMVHYVLCLLRSEAEIWYFICNTKSQKEDHLRG